MESNKVQELSLIQQGISQITMKKQELVNQLVEIDNAIEELKKVPKAYSAIGPILIEKSSEDITKELSTKKEMLNIKIRSFEKQEQRLKQKAEAIQKQVIEDMNKNSD